MTPLFAYAGLADETTWYGIVGRHPEWVPAVLPGWRVDQARGYAYLVEEEGGRVEGRLVRNMLDPDYWVLDDYQGVAEGLYERRTLPVQVQDGTVEAFAYVGGPTMTHL